MDRFYIARKFVTNEGRSKCYYEEGIFSTYELAYEFIKIISKEEDDSFLTEIVSYPIDSHTPCDGRDVYTFNRKGELLITHKAENRFDNCYVVEEDGYNTVYKKYDPESYTGKYKIGDIVFIRAYPWNKASPTYKDTVGVISAVPLSFDEWVASGNDKHTWDNAYVIDFIRDGYLGHWHVEERGIAFFNEDIPDNFKFLKLLSDHYQTGKTLSNEVLDGIIYGDIFIENVKHFNFSVNGVR